MTDQKVVASICDLMADGQANVQLLTLQPVCSSFSPMMRLCPWSSRTTKRPMGRANGMRLHKKEKLGNNILRGCLQLAKKADELGIQWVWEQPLPSLMWRTAGYKKLKGTRKLHRGLVDWCRHGREWKKSTLFEGTASWLEQVSSPCTGGHQHVHLEGQVKVDGKWLSRTSIASEYAAPFCQGFMKQAHLHYEKRNARYGLRAKRIGEASVPGPRCWPPSLLFCIILIGRWLLISGPPLDIHCTLTPTIVRRYGLRLDEYNDWALTQGLPRHSGLAELPIRIYNACIGAFLKKMTWKQLPCSWP